MSEPFLSVRKDGIMDSSLHHPPNNLPATLALVSSTKRDDTPTIRYYFVPLDPPELQLQEWLGSGPGVASDCGCLLQEAALKREEDK